MPTTCGDFKKFRLPFVLAFVAVAAYYGFSSSGITYTPVYLDPPPKLEGVYAMNDILSAAEILHRDKLHAPESVIIENNGTTLYATVNNGVAIIVNDKIVKTIPFNPVASCSNNLACSRPLGIRRLDADTLVIADSVRGLLTLNLKTEKYTQVIPDGTILHGKPVRFADDVAVIDKHRVVFTDASWAYSHVEFHASLLSGSPTGRVYLYDFSTQETKLLFDDLLFANGIELMPDGESFLVDESFTARIWRYYYAGPRQGQAEIFAENLPGYPDNVRLSYDRKSLYVAFFYPRRENDGFFTLDWVLRNTWFRWTMANLAPQSVIDFLFEKISRLRHGTAAQLDLEGNVLRVFDSPDGRVDRISQIQDDGKYLYICSYANPYLGRIPSTFNTL